MVFVRAYPRETQEMVFDAHDRAFAFFGGACARGIYVQIGRVEPDIGPLAGERPVEELPDALVDVPAEL
jgi:hypothetical protein